MQKRFWFALFLSLSALVPAVWGQSCPAPTLTTITIDGDPSDWSNVLQNCSQTTVDGSGWQIIPCSASTDRDCPTLTSGGDDGRDEIRFAWTYDSTYVYLYLERLAASTNQIEFVFYMDSNQNTFMDNNEKVYLVKTTSSNATPFELDNY